MNLVLHRAQVALNGYEFDITDQVTQQMNKVMPSIAIPPDGVSPLAQARPAAPAPGCHAGSRLRRLPRRSPPLHAALDSARD